MEHEPLLEDETASTHVLDRSSNGRRVESTSFPMVFLCIFAFAFCIEFGTNLLELPTIRLVELMVCRRYFDTNHADIDEEMCKIPMVQDKVAWIIGYKTTFDALPCILTVLFYGRLSDTWGRRFVIMLQTSGRLLALLWIVLIGFTQKNAIPELIWGSSLFLFIGASRKAQVTTVYASFCDVVPEEKRTRLLALVHASEGIAGLFSYPVSSALMSNRLWAPFALAIATNVFEYIVLCAMPETAPLLISKQSTHAIRPSLCDHQSTATIGHPHPVMASRIPLSSLWVMFKHRGLCIIFACFFVKRIAFAGEDFVSQWASEILHRRIYETFWLQISTHIGMLLTLSIIVPFVARHLKGPTRDLWVIRGSLVSVILGFLTLWRGRSIWIFCLACGLSEGMDVGLQSLGSYIVGEAHHGTFFPLSSWLGVAGELVGGPIMAALLTVRDENGQPQGYCFLLSAILFLGLLLSTRFITINKFHR